MVNTFRLPLHNYSLREITVGNILKENAHLEIKSFLNVGFHGWHDIRAHWWIRICNENNIDWKILEIFKPNIDDTIAKGCPANKIIHGNILNTNEYNNFDCILFWHGPEHIKKDVFIKALPDIEKKANKLIVFGMPLGCEPQDAAYGNPNEIHLSEWYPNEWKNLGYNVIEVHSNDVRYQHITVFRFLKDLKKNEL
jgi:hypothetical protein